MENKEEMKKLIVGIFVGYILSEWIKSYIAKKLAQIEEDIERLNYGYGSTTRKS